MTLTWEAVAAFLVVLTFVSGVWWRVEGMIRKNTDDLAAHKLHTAETYVTKVGLTEQTNQLIKAIDAVKTNSDASFALAKDLFGAKTFAEVIELQTSFARKQFDAMQTQVKEFQELTQKYVTEAAKPVTAQVEKTFKEFKAA